MLSMASAILLMKIPFLTPMAMATSILLMSVAFSLILYKHMTMSWLPFILIITFSSGMMTLFMYTTSLAPNEKTKPSGFLWTVPLLFSVLLIATKTFTQNPDKSMKTFSSQTNLLLMALILIMSMLAISILGHHPSQTLSSSF